MNIREVKLEDAPRLSEIARISVEPFKYVDFDKGGWERFFEATSISSTEDRIENHSYFCACGLQRDRIVGFITIKDFGKIDQLFVEPDAQKSGVARELWNYTKKKCLGSSAKGNIWVRSSSYAIPVYESFGFEKEGLLQKENGIVYQLMKLAANES